jgi:hypothetical protein
VTAAAVASVGFRDTDRDAALAKIRLWSEFAS